MNNSLIELALHSTVYMGLLNKINKIIVGYYGEVLLQYVEVRDKSA